MRKFAALLLTAGLLVAIAAASSVAATRTIRVGDNFYSPRSLTVARNTTVTWRNVGKSSHTVTVSKGPVKFRKSPLAKGRSYSRKLTRAGTYRIMCEFHSGQSMTLKVR